MVILADDLGWGDLRCYNPASKVPTPHLDRLASQGMRFTDAHSPSAVCTPTRYGLLTGRYAWRTRLKSGVLWGYSPPLIEPDRPTIAGVLQSAGYRTACVGKWHLGLGWPVRDGNPDVGFGDRPQPAADPAGIDWRGRFGSGPLTAGFDHFFGIPASLDMDPYVLIDDDRVLEEPSGTTPGDRSQRQGGGGFWRPGPAPAGFHPRQTLPALATHATDWIRKQSRDRPFFLYLPLTAPHDPWVPTDRFIGTSGAGAYGDFVAQVDAVVGTVLQAIETAGFTENTLVVFTSDNGAHWTPADKTRWNHQANGPWRGMKSDAYEGGHRVPFLVRWPGQVRPHSVSGALLGLQDLPATLSDIAGAPAPPGFAPDSTSFRGVLTGTADTARDTLVLHSINGVFALRQGPWKLIESPGSGGWTTGRETTPGQLYRLDSDPGESLNLFEGEPGRVAELRRRLAGIQGAGSGP